jgi:hypothetical protein
VAVCLDTEILNDCAFDNVVSATKGEDTLL